VTGQAALDPQCLHALTLVGRSVVRDVWSGGILRNAIAQHPVLKGERRARAPAALLLCAALASVLTPTAARCARISQAQTASLRVLAASYPCAAAAVVYVLRKSLSAQQGTLYLDAVPSPAFIAWTIDLAEAFDFPVQPNLYATSDYFVEVQWSVEKMGATAFFTARAQLVDRSGAPLKPVHIVERPVTLLIAENGFRLLGPAAAL
jgi:hypothetical protein